MRHFSGEFEGVRLLMEDELELVAGGEGEDTDDVQPAIVWAWLLNIGIGAIGGYLGNYAANASQNEARVAAMFDPAMVIGKSLTWQTNGNTNVAVESWNMGNGDLFIDTNQNKIPDLIIKSDPIGNIYSNHGDGFTQIYSPAT